MVFEVPVKIKRLRPLVADGGSFSSQNMNVEQQVYDSAQGSGMGAARREVL